RALSASRSGRIASSFIDTPPSPAACLDPEAGRLSDLRNGGEPPVRRRADRSIREGRRVPRIGGVAIAFHPFLHAVRVFGAARPRYAETRSGRVGPTPALCRKHPARPLCATAAAVRAAWRPAARTVTLGREGR